MLREILILDKRDNKRNLRFFTEVGLPVAFLCAEPAAPLDQLYFSKNLSVKLGALRALCVEKEVGDLAKLRFIV